MVPSIKCLAIACLATAQATNNTTPQAATPSPMVPQNYIYELIENTANNATDLVKHTVKTFKDLDSQTRNVGVLVLGFMAIDHVLQQQPKKSDSDDSDHNK